MSAANRCREANGAPMATHRRVHQEVIPKFAAYLDLHYPNAEDLCRHLSPLIHKEGINVRYLVRSIFIIDHNYCFIIFLLILIIIVQLLIVGAMISGSAAVLRQVGPPEAALLARDDRASGQGIFYELCPTTQR
jgi:hypothetical protein